MPDKRTTQRARQNPAPATELPACVPQTSTHYRQAGIDLGWPEQPGILEVDLWTPHGQDGNDRWPYWTLGIPPPARRTRDRCTSCGRFLRDDSLYSNRCSDCWGPEDEFV